MTQKPQFRILLVEDDPSTVVALRHLCARRGIATEVAVTGEEALASVARSKPGVVALDLKLAGDVDGFAVLEKLKSDPATSGVPVIVVTNYGMAPERERAKALHADGYLLKADHSVHAIVDRLLEAAERGVDDKPRIW
jgi:CheY-like chemotaxis protein